VSEANDLSQLLAGGFTMVVVKISEANRCNEYCKTPAKHHCEYFHNDHEYSVYKENVISHDKTDNAFVDKS
jgi:hypothetical protein